MATQLLSTKVQTAAHAALTLIQDRYGDNAPNENVLSFHSVSHTSGVVMRATLLAKAMNLSTHDIELVGIAAAFHDTVQRWEENALEDGKILRKRFAGQNEQDSSAEARQWMNSNGSYDAQAYQLVTDAILATIPGWNAEHGTVCQPNLLPDSHPVVRAVALADLGVAGMDGRLFTDEGDPLFREEQLDIARTLRSATSRSSISSETQEWFRSRMLGWCESQSGFAQGRQALLEKELGTLEEAAKQNVRVLFNNFDRAISASAELAESRKTLSFWELARAMGYDIPSL